MPSMTEVTDRWITPGPQPNGLQAADDGLWVIDQDNNHLYKLDYSDGSILARMPTESDHSSGVTIGGGHLWVSSTFGSRIFKLNGDGTTVDHYDTPGKGVVAFVDPANAQVTGAHGLQWVDERHMWMAVPPAQQLFLVDPRDMSVHHSIPTPSHRPHGVFVADGHVWCSDVGLRQVHKLDPTTGEIRAAIDVPDPEVHGMTLHNHQIWFCCALTRRVCTVPLSEAG
ncbi:MAG: hypothetical protein OXO54_13685 [Chloroflexota bacterium]|nr:hypothetical protein [Chloroflexota bacterium]